MWMMELLRAAVMAVLHQCYSGRTGVRKDQPQTETQLQRMHTKSALAYSRRQRHVLGLSVHRNLPIELLR